MIGPLTPPSVPGRLSIALLFLRATGSISLFISLLLILFLLLMIRGLEIGPPATDTTSGAHIHWLLLAFQVYVQVDVHALVAPVCGACAVVLIVLLCINALYFFV